MKLLIDAGNSRIKWALTDRQAWLRSGVLPVDQASMLPGLFAGTTDIRQIWVSNVAGEQIAQHIRHIPLATLDQLHFIAARDAQCGVSNGYANPGQLGSDRWAALLAAWHLAQGSCLVVNSGTATTIDALSPQGRFLGGLILPGIELMQQSLVTATQQLHPAQGSYAPFPANTADALFSGAVQATCGAIERQYRLLQQAGAPLLLSGGAASALLPGLDQALCTPRLVDNLVLHGLSLIAQAENL